MKLTNARCVTTCEERLWQRELARKFHTSKRHPEAVESSSISASFATCMDRTPREGVTTVALTLALLSERPASDGRVDEQRADTR